MYDSTRARAPTRLKIGPDPNPYPLLRTPTPYSEPLACVRTCACVEKDRDTSPTPNPLPPTPLRKMLTLLHQSVTTSRTRRWVDVEYPSLVPQNDTVVEK